MLAGLNGKKKKYNETMKTLFLVYNPKSGDGHIRAHLPDLCEYFTAQGYETIVYPTQAPMDGMERIAARGAGFERIVVCGGDGMLHEGVNGWFRAQTDAVLGYIPSGTVNDFANTHRLPKDVLQAAQIAVHGRREWIDVGGFNDDYFSYVAAFGLATSIAYDTPHEKKRVLGTLAYVLQAMDVVDFAHWENNCVTTKIEWEDGEASGDFLYGMVSNSRYVTGLDSFTRGLFDWKDGRLEGVFIRRPTCLPELNSILASMAKKSFEDNPLIIQVQSPWFRFEGEPVAWTLDGEYGGTHETVSIRVVPQALPVALAQEEEESLDH